MYQTKKPKAPANATSWLSIEQIRAGRMLADLSQEQAAEACDVSYSSWRGMERKRGRRRIQPKQMAKIVAGLRQYGVEFSREGVSYAEGYGPGDRSHQAKAAPDRREAARNADYRWQENTGESVVSAMENRINYARHSVS